MRLRVTVSAGMVLALLLVAAVASGERLLDFRMLYASFDPPFPGLITGVVKSSLEATISIYTDGTYVDIYDSCDTGGMEPFRWTVAFEPKVRRSVDVEPTIGKVRRYQFIGDIPLGERGRGHVQGAWFRADEGLPSRIVMYLAVSQIAGRGIAQAVNSYSVPVNYPQGHAFSR